MRRFFLFAALVAGALVSWQASVKAQSISLGCDAPFQAATRVELFFGLTADAGPVDDAAWNLFRDEVLVPAFPDGMTLFDAEGRSKDTMGGGARPSKVALMIVFDPMGLSEKMAGVVAAYRERFPGAGALLLRTPTCVTF